MSSKLLIYISIILLSLLSLAFMLCRTANLTEIDKRFSKNIKIAEKLSMGTKVNPIDYSFIDSLLEDKRIILLGEQQHADGTTQKLYSNLMLYLFKKGYNSLYLEIPFFKTHRFRMNLESGIVQDFSGSFYPFWSSSKQTKELRDSIVKFSKESFPLYIKGLDFQMSTVFSQNAIYEDLVSYMKTVPNFAANDFKQIRHSLTNRFGPVLYFNSESQKMDENRKSCLRELIEMRKLIEEKPEKTEKDSIYLQYLNNIYHFYYAKMYLRGSDYNNYRDSMMFENMVWQMNRGNTGKSVVWTANWHAVNESEGGIRLGAYIKQRYKDSVLTILTTSFSGHTTNISSGKAQGVNPATILTVESQLKDKTDDISFFVVPEKLKNTRAIMRFYGYNNIESEWFRKFDAFFFIKNMEPNEY